MMDIEPTLDITVLRTWLGKQQTMQDVITPDPASRMAATMDRGHVYAEGDTLPALWHWIYFLEAAPLSALGRDGHSARGGFMPPVALPRRMWAGSRFEFHAPVTIGMSMQKTSRIKDIAVKTGRSGALCFVTVEHVYTCGATVLLIEDHDLVYREDPKPDAPPSTGISAPEATAAQRGVTPSPTMLFRYSALTFNGHRIHYDRDYCKDIEGYPGLVVHGPLIGTMLAGLAEEKLGRLGHFSFKARNPLFDTEPFSIDGSAEGAFWATTPDGVLAMDARATAAEV